jgi:hypothetical protein
MKVVTLVDKSKYLPIVKIDEFDILFILGEGAFDSIDDHFPQVSYETFITLCQVLVICTRLHSSKRVLLDIIEFMALPF